jgi:hypothetical protein
VSDLDGPLVHLRTLVGCGRISGSLLFGRYHRETDHGPRLRDLVDDDRPELVVGPLVFGVSRVVPA